MSYQEIRSSIRSGDLLAWGHRVGWFNSWYDFKINFIRLFTRSEYTHVGIAWVVASRVFVLEAVEPKLRIFPLSKCGEFYWIPMSVGWHPLTEEYAMSKIGTEYEQLAAMLAPFSDVKDDQVNECAAYVIQVYRAEGVDLGTIAVPSNVVQAALALGKSLHFIEE